jgi:hypothetical protein
MRNPLIFQSRTPLVSCNVHSGKAALQNGGGPYGSGLQLLAVRSRWDSSRVGGTGDVEDASPHF